VSAADPSPWTLRSLLKSATQLLESRGSSSPRVDAELLLGHAVGLDRTQLYMKLDRPVSVDEREAFRALIVRRAKLEPIAYILGERGFWQHTFRVDPRVLIPRPETELLVEHTLAFVGARRDAPWRIADIGTGSGAVAISLAAELPNARIVATDISAAALIVATENAEALGVRDRIAFMRGDALEPLTRRDARVDVLVSNPPYIAPEERGALSVDVAHFEPGEALFADAGGLAVVRRILAKAPNVVVPGGLVLIEHGTSQGVATRTLAHDLGAVSTIRDYSGHDRVLRVEVPGELPETLRIGPTHVPVETSNDAKPTVIAGAHAPASTEPAADTLSRDVLEDERALQELSSLERARREARLSGLPVINLERE